MCEKLKGLPVGQIQFSCNIFSSLKNYCNILSKDFSRSGTVKRQIICESLTGKILRDSRQLIKIHEQFGLGRRLVSQSVSRRMNYIEGSVLTPLIERLARKPPSGENFVSLEWRNKACLFYEEDHRSELLKGTHPVYKEKIQDGRGGVTTLCRQKRVLRCQLCTLKVQAKNEIDWPFSLGSLLACRPP